MKFQLGQRKINYIPPQLQLDGYSHFKRAHFLTSKYMIGRLAISFSFSLYATVITTKPKDYVYLSTFSSFLLFNMRIMGLLNRNNGLNCLRIVKENNRHEKRDNLSSSIQLCHYSVGLLLLLRVAYSLNIDILLVWSIIFCTRTSSKIKGTGCGILY